MRKTIRVGLLTAGRDKPYALGLAPSLAEHGVHVDFIGSDMVDGPEIRNNPRIRVLLLRRQDAGVSLGKKISRIITYYARLMAYAIRSDVDVLHILWNNKFEYFDRTALMLYFRLTGKHLVFTAHNVNAGQRDNTDSWLNRLTLRIQYRLSHHLFVHTQLMQEQLRSDFGISKSRVTVIPFGINNTSPSTDLTGASAREKLGLGASDKVLLFFGNIAPYKGLHVLIEALAALRRTHENVRLVIAGRTKGSEDYWLEVQRSIDGLRLRTAISAHIEYIADKDVEIFFKAADVLVLPYTYVFQSGVLFLGYSFGLPVVASDVGSMREDIVEGMTGFVCRASDAADLAEKISTSLEGSALRDRERHQREICDYVNRKYSWSTVGMKTRQVYDSLISKNAT